MTSFTFEQGYPSIRITKMHTKSAKSWNPIYWKLGLLQCIGSVCPSTVTKFIEEGPYFGQYLRYFSTKFYKWRHYGKLINSIIQIYKQKSKVAIFEITGRVETARTRKFCKNATFKRLSSPLNLDRFQFPFGFSVFMSYPINSGALIVWTTTLLPFAYR